MTTQACTAGSGSTLHNGLRSRHLTMISIAGVIGAALFIGSGKVIANAGPAAILAYIAGGIVVVLVMRMLGEMASGPARYGLISRPTPTGPLASWAGFTIGWLYWYFWALLMGWEAYVAGEDPARLVPIDSDLGLHADRHHLAGAGEPNEGKKLR